MQPFFFKHSSKISGDAKKGRRSPLSFLLCGLKAFHSALFFSIHYKGSAFKGCCSFQPVNKNLVSVPLMVM